MTTWIALFRGINVGGNNMLPMKDLKSLLEKNGCTGVRTYIQSGNAVFRSALSDPKKLERRIAGAVAKSHGFEPRIVLITEKDFAKAAAANPYSQASNDPKTVHLFFLAEAPKKVDLNGLDAVKTATERFELQGRVFYVHTPDGLGKSKLAERAERLLGVAATARNWRTVTALIELSKS